MRWTGSGRRRRSAAIQWRSTVRRLPGVEAVLSAIRTILLFGLAILALSGCTPDPARSRLIGGQAWSYTDPTGRMTIDEIVSGRATLFQPPSGNPPSEGLPKTRVSRFWLALDAASVENFTSGGWPGPMVLTIEDPRIRSVDLYERSAGGTRRETWTGSTEGGSAGGGLRYPVFLLDPKPDRPRELFLAIETDAAVRGLVRIADFQNFVAQYDNQTLVLAFVIGLRTAILVYVLALGTILVSRTNLWLAAMVAAGLVQIASDNGLIEALLAQDASVLSRSLSLSSMLAGQLLFVGFTTSFLRMRRRMPALKQFGRIFILILAVLTVASVVDGVLDLGQTRAVVGYTRIALVAFTLFVAFASMRTAPMRALAFLLCWSPATVAVVIRFLRDWAPQVLTGENLDTATLVGPTISVILFTLLASVDVRRREGRLKTEVRRTADRFRAFAGIGTDAFWEIDREGRLSFLAGHPAGLPQLALGDRFADVVQASTSGEAAAPVRAAIDGDQPFDDCRLRLAERGERDAWISLSGRPIPPGGRTGGSVYRGLIRDVTEDVEREGRRMIEQQMFALGQLAGSVAHEINNLIHPIINLTKRLRIRNRAFDDQEGDRMMDLIDLSSRQAAKVVSELLQTMRGERLKDIDRPLSSAVEQALETVRPALPSSVRVELATDDLDGPPVRIGDMLQVIGNLVSNAVHAMNGQGTIRIALVHGETGAKLSVVDDGSGMEERVRLRALQPFFSTKTDGRGTGVGLYIVQRIVAEYGGWINIESALSEGTTVTIFFPFRKDDHAQ